MGMCEGAPEEQANVLPINIKLPEKYPWKGYITDSAGKLTDVQYLQTEFHIQKEQGDYVLNGCGEDAEKGEWTFYG